MLSQKRIQSLQSKRAIIAKQVEDEEKSPSMDPTLLRHLKKQKLELKEIISGLRDDSTRH